eukprot:g3964.t1
MASLATNNGNKEFTSFILLRHSKLTLDTPLLQITLQGDVSRLVIDSVKASLKELEETKRHYEDQFSNMRYELGAFSFNSSSPAFHHGEILLLGFVRPIQKIGFVICTDKTILQSFSSYGDCVVFQGPAQIPFSPLDDMKQGTVYNISDDVALDLRPGQILNMGKLGTANHSMIIGVGWDATVSKTEMMMHGKNYKPPDLDLEICLCDYQDSPIQLLTPKSKRQTSCGGLVVTADATDGENIGDDERAIVKFKILSKQIHSILVCIRAVAHAGEAPFTRVRNVYARMLHLTNTNEYEIFRIRVLQHHAGNDTMARMFRMKRAGDSWTVHALSGPETFIPKVLGPTKKINPMIDINASGDNNQGKLQIMAPSLQPALEKVKKCFIGPPGFDLNSLGSPDYALIGIGWLNVSNTNDLIVTITELDESGYAKTIHKHIVKRQKMGGFNGKKLFHDVTIMEDSIHFDRDCCRILVRKNSTSFAIGISGILHPQHGAYLRFIQTKKNPETTIAMRHLPHVNLANQHPNDGAIKTIVHFAKNKFFMDDNSFNILEMPKDFTPDVFKPVQFDAFSICFAAGNYAKNDPGRWRTRVFNICGEEISSKQNNVLSNVSKIFYARETDTTQALLHMKKTLASAFSLMRIYSIILDFHAKNPSAGAYFRVVNSKEPGQECLKDEEGNDLCVSPQKIIVLNFIHSQVKPPASHQWSYDEGLTRSSAMGGPFIASTVNISHVADKEAVFNSLGLMNTCPAANRIQYPFKFTLEYIHAMIPAADIKNTFMKKNSGRGTTDAYMKIYVYDTEAFNNCIKNIKNDKSSFKPTGDIISWIKRGDDHYKKERKQFLKNVLTTEVTKKIPCPSWYKLENLNVPFNFDEQAMVREEKLLLHEKNKRVIVLECWDKDLMSADDLIFRHRIDMAELNWNFEKGFADCFFEQATFQAPVDMHINSNLGFRNSQIKCRIKLELVAK